MTKRQIAKALEGHRQRRQAENMGRRVVTDYPYDHNPYLAHVDGPTCERVCAEGHAKVIHTPACHEKYARTLQEVCAC